MTPFKHILVPTDFGDSSIAALEIAIDLSKKYGTSLTLLHTYEIPAAVEIQKTIGETHADLVVMGTHGRQGVSRALLGSVAERTVRLSPVPVLTVRGTPKIST